MGQILFEHSRATTIRFCVPNPLFRFFHNTMLIVSCIVKGVLCLAMEFFEIAYVETFGITCYGKNQRPSQLLRKEIYLQSFLQGGGPCFLPSSTLTPSFFVTYIFYMYTSLKNHHVLLQTCSGLRIKLLARYLVGHKPVKKGGFWGPLD